MFYVLPIFFVYIAALCSYIHPVRVEKYKILLSLAYEELLWRVAADVKEKNHVEGYFK